MNNEQKLKCKAIIHSHAAAAAAGNAFPIPGLGLATDMVTMASMTMSLCAVFGGSIQEEAAKSLALATLKNTMLSQPVKVVSKELSKFIPFLGQAVAPTLSVVILEAAGWNLADDLYDKFSKKQAQRLIDDYSLKLNKNGKKEYKLTSDEIKAIDKAHVIIDSEPKEKSFIGKTIDLVSKR